MVEVGAWLRSLGLEQYAEAFQENAIDEDVLPDLSDQDLATMGVLLGHRKKMLKAIAALSVEATATDEALHLPVAPTSASGERRQLTVMFCDLAGSTDLSTRLDPEDLQDIIRAYQDSCASAIAEFDGYLAKYMGDGVLIYFGYPRAHGNDAERALRAALAIVDGLPELNANIGVDLDTDLAVRIGIATGIVVVGQIVGEGDAQERTVVGETPNLAARLQSLAAPNSIVVGSLPKDLAGDGFVSEDLGSHELKGITRLVRAWGVRGLADPIQAESEQASVPPLVGRDEEVGLLHRAWQQTKDEERGRAVLISGEPGIGKTVLIETLRAQARKDGQSRIAFRCSPYHTGSALYPVIEHLRRLLEWQREDTPGARLIRLEALLSDTSLPMAEAVPLFASLLSLPLPDDRYPPLELPPQQLRQQTQDALIAWMLDEAERCTLLTLCEDLHWADPSTLEFLGLLLDQAPTVPILLVFTTRPDFQPSWPPRSHMTPITLARLERPQTEVLITRLAGGKALPAEVVKHIVAKTDGVPLFVEELTKTVLGSDVLHEEADRFVLAGSLSTVTIPATLQDSLMARLDRFPTVREVVQLGAVLGREFAYEMLRALVDMEEPLLQEGLDRLVDGELLYQRGRPPRARYIFKHALVQDAAYQSLLKRKRQRCHEQVAQLLEVRFPEIVETQPELLAHHYIEAGLAEKSHPYWYKAGQRAIERSANLEAIVHLTRGRELLTRQPASAERDLQELDFCLALGPALMSTRGLAAPEAEEIYLRARELCQTVDQAALSFQATWGLWLVYQQRGQIDLAQSAANEVLTLAERQRENVGHLLQAYHAAWTTQLFVGNISASRTHAVAGDALYDIEKHRNHAFTYGGHDPGVCAKTTKSEALCLLGYTEQAVRHAADAVALAEKLSHPFSLAMARYFVAQVHQYRLEADIVRSHAQAAISMCESHGFESFRAQAAVLLGWGTALDGDSEQGIAQIREGLAAWKSTGTGMRRPYFLGLLADALLRIDRTVEGLEVIEECETLIEISGETRWQAETVRLKAALMDRAGAASKDIEITYLRALEIARGQEARLLQLRAATSLGHLWHGQGKTKEARQLLGPLYAWFTEGFDAPDVRRAKTLLDELS